MHLLGDKTFSLMVGLGRISDIKHEMPHKRGGTGQVTSMKRAYSGPRSRLCNRGGHEYETNLRSRLWDREVTSMGQNWDGIRQGLDARIGPVCERGLQGGDL